MDMNKEQKKISKINVKVIISLLLGLTAFSTILLVTIVETFNNKEHQNSSKNQDFTNEINNTSQETMNIKKTEKIAIVKNIDREKSLITLFDINASKDMTISYYGGSDIRDKFGEITSIGQITIGSIVDVEYINNSNKLTKLQVSNKAWEYVGVNNLLINLKDKMMDIATSKYKYTDNIIIIDDENIVPVVNLTEQDELTIRGIDEVIWSVTVTRGHGTVKLKDYDTLLGGFVTVGYEAMLPITENMQIPVREGTYNMTVENGDYSATVDVTINRNQDTEVSLKGLGPEPLKYGNVAFNITPFGADLFIDGELSTYSKPATISYGKHKLMASLGGYTSYDGILTVDKAETSVFIDLPEMKIDDDDNELSSLDPDDNNIDDQEPDNSDVVTEDEPIIDEEHSIYVQNPNKASVYLNGEFKGISPVIFDKIIGKHVLTFIRDGYLTKSYSIEVADDDKDAYFSFSDLVKID